MPSFILEHRRASRPAALAALAIVGLLALGAGTAAADAGVDISPIEGQPFSGRVANTDCTIATASIDWGDGTPKSAGSDAGTPPGVTGGHTYADEGVYSGTVAYGSATPGGPGCVRFAVQHFQATVGDAALSAAGREVAGHQGQAVSDPVAHFTDANPGAGASDFSAAIDWGDGSTTAGSVARVAAGGFDVTGAHPYATAGSFAVSVTVTDVGGSTATAAATARIAAGPAPLPPPPPPSGGGPPVNLKPPFISFSPSNGSFVCDPGTWQNLPPGQTFTYEWLRRNAPAAQSQLVSVVARTQTYKPGDAVSRYLFSCRVTVPGFTGSTIPTPDFSRLTPTTVPISAYGNFRIRGIDVFQVVQPNSCAALFSFPTGGFPCLSGGGTPTSYGPSGTLAAGADPQRTNYVGVQIDADKQTTAVVYVDRTSGVDNPGQTLEVTLMALWHGRQIGVALTRLITKPLPFSITPWVAASERGDPTYGVQFQIPATWLGVARQRRGTIDLIAKVGFPPGTPNLIAVECNPRELMVKDLRVLAPSACASDNTFRLDRVPALRLIALNIRTLELLGTNQNLGSINAPEPLLARARQLFPGGESMSVWPYANWIGVRDQETLSAALTPQPGGAPPVLTCNGVAYPKATSDAATRACRTSAIAAVVRQWDVQNPSSGYDATVGFHDYAIPLAGGTVKEPGTTFGTLPVVARSPGTLLPLSLINDGTISRPLGATAHEFGHVLGLAHASNACGGGTGGQVGEPWPADQIGRLQSVEFDQATGNPVTPVLDTTANPLFDLMSYCGPGATPSAVTPNQSEPTLWLSARNWNHAFSTLRSYAAVPGVQAAGRFASARAAATAPSGQAFVIGVVGPGGARIVRVVPPHGHDAIPATAPDSALRLRALDSAGRVLVDEGVQVQTLPDAPGAATFVGPVPAGAAAVELVSHGAVLDRKQRNQAPRVRLLGPGSRAHVRTHGSLSVRWSARDPEGDQLQATVDYSFDGGRSWRTIYDGPSTGSASVPGRFLEGSHDARIRVFVNDGFNEAHALSPGFRADGTPPVAQIIRPGTHEPVRSGERTLLMASAFDDRHRSLRGRALTWYAGRHGLGSGEQIEASLPAGRIVLRLVTRDRGGHQTVLRRVLRVAPAPLRLLALRAPEVVRHRARTITVRVATSSAATLKTGGQRYRVGRRPRTIVVRLPRRPAAGLLTLPIELTVGGPGAAGNGHGAIVVVRL